jgi:hypothetical protein
MGCVTRKVSDAMSAVKVTMLVRRVTPTDLPRYFCVSAWLSHSVFLFTEMYDMIYLLITIGLSPGGSTHLHTNNTHNNTNYNRKTQIKNNEEECGPCPVFASFTLAFALQLRKKYGKTSVTVGKTSVRLIKTSVSVQYTYYQNTHTLQNSHQHTHTHTHTHTHYKTI